MMKCPICNGENHDQAQFCKVCGAKIPRCPGCGMVLTKRVRFCTKDGTAIPEEVLALIPEEKDSDSVMDTVAAAVARQAEENIRSLPEDEQTVAVVQKPEEHPCVRCGKPAAAGRKLCDACRQELLRQRAEKAAAQRRFCTRCGKPCETSDQRLCNACRSQERVRQDDWEKPEKKSKLWMIVLLLVFLLGLAAAGYFLVTSDFFADIFDPASNSAQKDDSQDSDNEDDEPSDDEDEAEGTVPETAAPTAAPTDAPTEPPTEAPTEAPTEPEEDPLLYVIENCDKMYLSETDLAGFDAQMCRIARNACYAKSGRKFNDTTLQAYFEQFDWYVPSIAPDNFTDDMLNEYQRANVKLIQNYEAARGY